MSGLPKGWRMSLIEELLEDLDVGKRLHQGWSPRCHKEPSEDDNVWGVLKTTAIQKGEYQPEHNKRLPDTLEPRPSIEVKAGDLLLTCAGPRVRCGVPCMIRTTRPRLMMSGKMYRFRADRTQIEPEYLEAFLLSKDAQDAIDRMKTGISESGLNLTHGRFKTLELPVAPLPEQRRIVARIEELFSRLDTGVTALRHAKAQLQRYRQSVLAAAVTGQLTQAWREQHTDTEPAEELLERILKQRREEWSGRGKYKEPALELPDVLPALPETWTWSTSGHLFDCIVPNRDKPKSFTGDVPWVTLPDFDGRGVIDRALDGTGLTQTEIEDSRARLVPKGSVIMSCIGRFGLAAVLGRDAVVNQQLHAFLIPDDLPARYFAYSLQAQRAFMESIATSTTIAYLNKSNCNRVPVALPPLAEQHQIVAEVEARTTDIDHLEAELDHQITRANRLRQSILSSAFSGKLVT